MSDQLSRTNDTPLHMEPPRTEDQAAEALTGKALTLEYRPARANALAISESDSGRFGAFSWRVLHDIESMICHPDVAQPYSYYKAGISSVKFEVTAQTMEQAKFAHELLTRIWERHLDQLQYAYDYGWCGYELTYADDDHGRMDLDQILDLHPLDVWAVTRKGQYRGLRLKPSGLSSLPSGGILRLQGSTDLWGPGKWPAKALWLTHERRFDRFYGRTQLLGAWRPWMRLAGRDGAEDVLDGCLYRVGYQGPEIRYPPEDFKKTGGGVDYDAARNEARQMAEQAKSGFSVALPSTYHQGGQPKWEVKFPTSAMSGIGTFLDWESNLQKQISRGVGVPPELLEASDTGSGYSGRKIPLLGFYESQLKNARNIVRALVDQVVLPLLKWNWGDDAWAEVKVDLEPPAAITGDKEQAQGGMPPQGAQMPPSPDGQPGAEQGPEGMPGLADLLAGGGEMSTVSGGIEDDSDWFDPGWYPSDDVDYWSEVVGYELAAPDMSRYAQRQITRGPRKGQSGYYDSVSKKFMPADWKPGQKTQEAASAPAQKQKTSPKSAAAPAQSGGVPATPAALSTPATLTGSSGKKAGPESAKPAVPTTPAPKQSSAAPAAIQMTPEMSRIANAAQKDLADKSHPLQRMRDQLAVANFGSGDVRTIRPTKDAPLSKQDHEAMDRMHSRTAAALKMSGRDQEAAAQIEAAKYHRGIANKQPQQPQPQTQTAAPPVKPPAPPKTGTAAPGQPEQPKSARDSVAPNKQGHFDHLTKGMDRKLSPKDVEARRGHVAKVLNRMSDGAARRLRENSGDVSHFANSDDLSATIKKNFGKDVRAYGAYVNRDPRKGGKRPALLLDGIEGRSGAEYHGTAFTADSHDSQRGTYAHEMAHALDGPGLKHSASPEWQKAFADEIAKARKNKKGEETYRLSKYAATKASEGFAEFGRLIYGTDIDHKHVEKAMPQCYAYFKKQGWV